MHFFWGTWFRTLHNLILMESWKGKEMKKAQLAALSNPRPLDHEASSLPLCYNHVDQCDNRWVWKSISVMLATQKIMLVFPLLLSLFMSGIFFSLPFKISNYNWTIKSPFFSPIKIWTSGFIWDLVRASLKELFKLLTRDLLYLGLCLLLSARWLLIIINSFD